MAHPIDLGVGFNSLPILQQRVASGGGGGGGGFSGNVIHLDGVNDFAYLIGALATSVGSNDQWIFNLWFNPYFAVQSDVLFYNYQQATIGHAVQQLNFSQMLFDKANGTTAAEFDSDVNSYLAGVGSGWTHWLGASDGNSMWLLVNSRHINPGVGYTFNNTGAYWVASGPHHLFTNTFSIPCPALDFCEYYFNMGEGLDLSQQANVELFRNAAAPADLGTNGTSVTGNTPTLYFTGDAAAWNAGSANVGYTDNQFTVVGAFTDANTSP